MVKKGYLEAPSRFVAERSKPATAMRIAKALGLALQTATTIGRARRETFQVYPLPTIKKKRACVITYRHSGDRLLKNSFPPHSIVNKL